MRRPKVENVEVARVVYALCGEGRGHLSRTLALAHALGERGHELVFCCGGSAKEALEARRNAGGPGAANIGEILEVPALGQAIRDNRVDLFRTVRRNLGPVLFKPEVVRGLAKRLEKLHPAGLVTDFEPFSALAAELVGLPVVSLNRQQILTETRVRVPRAHRLSAALTAGVVRHVAPRRPARVVTPSFAPGASAPRRPERSSLVPPILRPAVRARTPSVGEHIVVYYNHAGAEGVVEALRRVDHPFVLFGFGRGVGGGGREGNLTFRPPSDAGFLDALASSRGVICTAGFTLLSETLYLGKPVLTAPNRGSFEQVLNALELTRARLGEAVIGRPLTGEDVAAFVAGTYEGVPKPPFRPGNDEAADIIEKVLVGVPAKGVLAKGVSVEGVPVEDMSVGTGSSRPARAYPAGDA